MVRNGYDETNGVVVGGETTWVEYWQRHPEFGWPERIASAIFSWGTTDQEMADWFKTNYPEQGKRQFEMRIFDL